MTLAKYKLGPIQNFLFGGGGPPTQVLFGKNIFQTKELGPVEGVALPVFLVPPVIKMYMNGMNFMPWTKRRHTIVYYAVFVGLFGTVQYGVHINGYFRHPKKGMYVWVGKRSMSKPTWPGKLDQMVSDYLIFNIYAKSYVCICVFI